MVKRFDNDTEMNKFLPGQAKEREQQKYVTGEGKGKKKRIKACHLSHGTASNPKTTPALPHDSFQDPCS